MAGASSVARVVANGGVRDSTRVDTSATGGRRSDHKRALVPKARRGGDEPRRANTLPRTRIRSATARRFLLRRPPQLQQDVVDARPAFVAIFLEAGTYQPVKGWRAQGLRSGDWRRLGREDCRDQARLALPGEGLRRRDQLVKDGTKAKMSVRASTSFPSSCSGDMYCSVPTMSPASVWLRVNVAAASPLIAARKRANPEIQQLHRPV